MYKRYCESPISLLVTAFNISFVKFMKLPNEFLENE